MRNLFLMSIFLMLVGSAQAQQNKTTHRVVFQMSSGEAAEQKGLINNVNNLLSLWENDVVIHVVIHGPGIALVQTDKTAFKAEIHQLVDRGVVFQVCENTLKQKEIDKASIIERMEYIPSGIAEIVLRQEQGWSYIKSNF
ncbi:DsrE family protein [Flavobacterium sp. JP2137]|uniref:DsrE family protein n=1 Tax=Flavobacterium sp. JP2137 TaxID=3414510 RepID=UPI003D2FEFB5